MELKLTDEQLRTLLYLVKTEMDGLCGDLGYAELSKIKIILEQQLLDADSVEEPSNS
ncbi:hypothetical protein [Vibrio sp. B181a]|uniref:hypothetical protein n=1 Tax=Vibrio sp. B181a TaxID=2835906 RepID=UPI002554C399|nr:hypothetical protein [Vibrio sp. B181a]MDK9773787.1 hypothetical protein [Vibrio sp. B181a]